VLSEEKSGAWYIEPLHFNGEPQKAWTKVKAAVQMLGGRIENEAQGICGQPLEPVFGILLMTWNSGLMLITAPYKSGRLRVLVRATWA